MTPLPGTHPILPCDEARALEARLFAGDEEKEWSAMQQAGRAVANAVVRDFEEIGGCPSNARLLVLVGKGHNGGDALIATRALLEKFPAATADVWFAFGERTLRPLVVRAWRDLGHAAAARAAGLEPSLERVAALRGVADLASAYDLCLDGVFGFQFRPPADPKTTEFLQRVNALPIRLRAAIDLPSAGLFRADFTYATGSVKEPIVDQPEAGRVRYLDLGFFRGEAAGAQRVLTPALLAPVAALRAAQTDKRSYGHVLVLGGSRSYPGAVLMTVLGALRSGVGLVTAFVPESLVPAYAARAPEAMWVAWPETPEGGLALEGEHLLCARFERASALVLGPGMAREAETLALAASIADSSPVPLVVDADALQPGIVRAGRAARVLTPHAGEFKRIAQGGEFDANTVVVLKGPVTRVWQGAGGPRAIDMTTAGEQAQDSRATVYHSFFGGPALARGGSGDILAGLIGGLLAQTPQAPLLAAARGVVWHGLAADLLARAHGQTAVQVTQLLDYLSAALRNR